MMDMGPSSLLVDGILEKDHTGPLAKVVRLSPISQMALSGPMLRPFQEGGPWAGHGWGHQLLSPTL